MPLADLATIKLAEAELLLEDAESRANEDDPYSPSIAMSHATQAVILAVDALCHHHRVPPAKRHDQINRTFLDLIRTQRLPETASRWRDLLAQAISQKSQFQYGGELASRSEARGFVRSVGQLVGFVAAHIRGTGT